MIKKCEKDENKIEKKGKKMNKKNKNILLYIREV